VAVAAPVAVAVKVTEQVPLARVQLVGLKVPAAPVDVKLTVPVGVLAVPGELSATVALHELPWPTATGDEHETVVVVPRRLTVIVPVPVLMSWVVSPP